LQASCRWSAIRHLRLSTYYIHAGAHVYQLFICFTEYLVPKTGTLHVGLLKFTFLYLLNTSKLVKWFAMTNQANNLSSFNVLNHTVSTTSTKQSSCVVFGLDHININAKSNYLHMPSSSTPCLCKAPLIRQRSITPMAQCAPIEGLL